MSIRSATAPVPWTSRLSLPRRTAPIIVGLLAVIAIALFSVSHIRPRPPVLPPAEANALGLRMAEAAEDRDVKTVSALLEKGANPNQPSRDGSTALLWAVHFADIDLVDQLLSYGANPNATNRFGLTALHLASEQGDAKIAKRLIRAGANPAAADKVGITPLMKAAIQGSAEIADQLIDAGAPVDASDPAHHVTALMLAGWCAHPEVTRRLLDAGARVDIATKIGPTPKPRPPNPPGGGSHGDGIIRGGIPPQGARAPVPGGMTALLYAVRGGDRESTRMLLDAGAKIETGEANAIRPLLMAILNNRIDIATDLIGRGANVNAADWYGRTPLWSAVEMRNLELATDNTPNDVDRPAVLKLIALLLEKKADPNARQMEYPPTRQFLMQGGSLSWVDFTGQTAFLRAAQSGDVDAMRLLLKYGADPNIATLRGTTPLMAAAGVNWVYFQTYDDGEDRLIEAIRLCMTFGQSVNASNSMKVTPLHGAANRGANKIVRFLVDQGARLEDADDQGRTALSWARGVFLATLPAQPKPATMALIEKYCTERGLHCEGRKPAPQKPASNAATAAGAPRSTI